MGNWLIVDVFVERSCCNIALADTSFSLYFVLIKGKCCKHIFDLFIFSPQAMQTPFRSYLQEMLALVSASHFYSMYHFNAPPYTNILDGSLQNLVCFVPFFQYTISKIAVQIVSRDHSAAELLLDKFVLLVAPCLCGCCAFQFWCMSLSLLVLFVSF